MTKKKEEEGETPVEGLIYLGPLIYANVPARDLSPDEVARLPVPAAVLLAGGSYIVASKGVNEDG